MDKNSLKLALFSLGINGQEAEAYITLARLGPSTSGPIIAKTGLHRNVVYTALEHLVSRKFVLETQVHGKKQFVLADPTIISQEFSRKAETAREMAKQIEAIAKRQSQEITIHEGNEEFITLLIGLIRQLQKGSTKYVLGTGGQDFMEITMHQIWTRYHKVAHEQQLKIKMISYESQRQAIADDAKKEKIYDVRYLPDEIENPAGVHIYPDVGVILNIIYSTQDSPVTAIRIKNNQLSQAQLHLFNNLWKMGKR